MGLRLHTPPAAEPVSLAEAKQHCRIDGSDEDVQLEMLIASAREYCEAFQGRSYVAQAWRATLDRFPAGDEDWRADMGFVTGGAGAILLPRPPAVSVTSITYVDANGTTQTWSVSAYRVDTESEPGRITPAYGECYPSTREQTNAVTITYVAGVAAPFTVDATANVCTAVGRAFAAADIVRLTNADGALPGGLAVNTDYHVRDVSGSTFKLAATAGGAAIDITSAGSGTHFVGAVPGKVRLAMLLLVGHWYGSREAAMAGAVSKEIEFAVTSLLTLDRTF